MAEPAPLTTAHAHARTAALETQQVHWDDAADAHESAAADYSKAARGTSDSEALRVLKLLEEQHIKLASIIKSQDVEEHSEAATEAPPADLDVSRRDFAQAQKPTASPPAQTKPSTSALAATRFGSQVRDSSPSLAREIASRRGIPQPGRKPPSAAAQARARQLSPESHRRSRSGPATPKIPPSVMDSQNLSQPKKGRKAEDDDAFTKFYSNLTTGTMSKLSSVLAYAGLPLTAEDVQIEQDKAKLNKRTVSASNEPDVKNIFSKAALDAIEDDHRQRGTQGRVFGPAESFYVVQKGGGTYSYAAIANPQLGGIDEDDEDAFVDAREAQAPTSPKHSRFGTHPRGSFGKSKTHEELELECEVLKNTLVQLNTRLSEFENHAQDASMAALTQSMVSLSPQVPAGGPDQALADRLRQLEQQLEHETEERQRLKDHAAKQEKTLKQYKAKWEDIKKSAKEKERAKKEKAEQAEAATTTEPN